MSWWRRLGRWARSTAAPVLYPAGAETCPTCRRPIPGAIAPQLTTGVDGPMRVAPRPSPSELRALCPIDGSLARTYAPAVRAEPELRDVAERIARALRAGHHRGWATHWADALAANDEERFRILLGHALGALLRRGPWPDSGWTRPQLEQLLVDVVATWPPRPPATG